DEINPVKPNTIASSIAIGNPADGYYFLQAMGGLGESVTDDKILEGIHPFGPNRGNNYRACWGTEVAVTKKLIQNGKIPPEESIVISVTATRYKPARAADEGAKKQ